MTSIQEENTCIHVVVRVRPLSKKERETNTCIHIESTSDQNDSPQFQTIRIGENKSAKNFTFDNVFSPQTNQQELYSTCINSLVQSCLKGYNTTVFAYGQTGSGKTYTMIGDLRSLNHDSGVIPRALEGIFVGLEQTKKDEMMDTDAENQKSFAPLPSSKPPFEYEVKVQFLGLYGEDIFDLVGGEDVTSTNRAQSLKKEKSSKRKVGRLVLRDGKDGEDAEVIGAGQAKVQSSEMALEYLQRGMKMRHIAPTAMNAESSRSHVIFTLLIQQTYRKAYIGSSENFGEQKVVVEMKTSKMHFVDLAGSERIKSAKTQGKRYVLPTRDQENLSLNYARAYRLCFLK